MAGLSQSEARKEFAKSLETWFERMGLFDLTIETSDKRRFPCISSLIKMQCPYFALKLSKESKGGSPLTVLVEKDLTSLGFDYIYRCFMNLDTSRSNQITQKNVWDILKCAIVLGLQSLIIDCSRFIDQENRFYQELRNKNCGETPPDEVEREKWAKILKPDENEKKKGEDNPYTWYDDKARAEEQEKAEKKEIDAQQSLIWIEECDQWFLDSISKCLEFNLNDPLQVMIDAYAPHIRKQTLLTSPIILSLPTHPFLISLITNRYLNVKERHIFQFCILKSRSIFKQTKSTEKTSVPQIFSKFFWPYIRLDLMNLNFLSGHLLKSGMVSKNQLMQKCIQLILSRGSIDDWDYLPSNTINQSENQKQKGLSPTEVIRQKLRYNRTRYGRIWNETKYTLNGYASHVTGIDGHLHSHGSTNVATLFDNNLDNVIATRFLEKQWIEIHFDRDIFLREVKLGVPGFSWGPKCLNGRVLQVKSVLDGKRGEDKWIDVAQFEELDYRQICHVKGIDEWTRSVRIASMPGSKPCWLAIGKLIPIGYVVTKDPAKHRALNSGARASAHPTQVEIIDLYSQIQAEIIRVQKEQKKVDKPVENGAEQLPSTSSSSDEPGKPSIQPLTRWNTVKTIPMEDGRPILTVDNPDKSADKENDDDDDDDGDSEDDSFYQEQLYEKKLNAPIPDELKIDESILKNESIKEIPAKMIPYTLQMSSKYGGPPNNFKALVNTDLCQGAGTHSGTQEWIQADLGEPHFVECIRIGAANGNMSGGWGHSYVTQCVLQYRSIPLVISSDDPSISKKKRSFSLGAPKKEAPVPESKPENNEIRKEEEEWIGLTQLNSIGPGKLYELILKVNTNGVRIYNPGHNYVGIGCLQIVGRPL